MPSVSLHSSSNEEGLVKESVKRAIRANSNVEERQRWLTHMMKAIPLGLHIRDVGGDELRKKSVHTYSNYVSQGVCQYAGSSSACGLQTGSRDTRKIDFCCDIAGIPEQDGTFNLIRCRKVFEHLPDALKGRDEFTPLLNPGGMNHSLHWFTSLQILMRPSLTGIGTNIIFHNVALSFLSLQAMGVGDAGNIEAGEHRLAMLGS